MDQQKHIPLLLVVSPGRLVVWQAIAKVLVARFQGFLQGLLVHASEQTRL